MGSINKAGKSCLLSIYRREKFREKRLTLIFNRKIACPYYVKIYN